jgi:hypothetical protein
LRVCPMLQAMSESEPKPSMWAVRVLTVGCHAAFDP